MEFVIYELGMGNCILVQIKLKPLQGTDFGYLFAFHYLGLVHALFVHCFNFMTVYEYMISWSDHFLKKM